MNKAGWFSHSLSLRVVKAQGLSPDSQRMIEIKNEN